MSDIMNDIVNYSDLQLTLKKTLIDNRIILGKLQQEINDILHVIEYMSLPASKLSIVMKKLKESYVKRRELKESIIIIQNIIEHNKNGFVEIEASKVRMERYKTESLVSYNKIMGK
jgi:hypothetical protein